MKKENPGCFLVLLALMLIPISMSVNVWTFLVMWRWFVVPSFGMHQLAFWQAIGLVGVLSVLKPLEKTTKPDEASSEAVYTAIAMILGKAGMILTIGWIAKQMW